MGVCARKKRRCRYSSVEVDMSDTIKMRPREYIKIRGANEHNLKAIDIGVFVFVCKAVPGTDGEA